MMKSTMTSEATHETQADPFARAIDIDWLIYLRVVFGTIIAYWGFHKLLTNQVVAYYIEPSFHFYYSGFEWVKPLPGQGMVYLFCILIIAATALAAGAFYRVTSVIVFSILAYVFLIERSLYLNHDYLITMVAGALIILPANAKWSIDVLRIPNLRSETTEVWQLGFVRFLVGMPYFFGGIAKLNADWLRGHPMAEVLASKADRSLFGPWYATDSAAYFFSYGGLFFDLLVVPALLYRRTRLVAFVVAILFHLSNHFMFRIGVFPWFMIFSTFVFLQPGWIRKLMGWSPLGIVNTQSRATSQSSLWQMGPSYFRAFFQSPKRIAVAAFIFIQCALPLRVWLVAGDVSWHEVSHYFSWRMLLRGKSVAVQYFVSDPITGRTGTVDPRSFISGFQAHRFAKNPEMIRQLAVHMDRQLKELGIPEVEVRVLAYAALNGRKPALLIDPDADLSEVQPVGWFKKPDWILDNAEPLRSEPWKVPMAEWSLHLPTPARFQPDTLQAANRLAAQRMHELLSDESVTRESTVSESTVSESTVSESTVREPAVQESTAYALPSAGHSG